LTFVLSLLVITFVISLSFVFRIVDLISRGIPWEPVVRILLASFPSSLTLSIPMSALFSCLLVFGRMSDDGEITAMKASGLSLWRIGGHVVLFSMLLTCICLFVNHYVEPRAHYVRRSAKSELQSVSPIELLEEGRFQHFDGATLYIGRKTEKELQDVRIYDARNPAVVREIRAKTGTVQVDETGRHVIVDLRDVRIDPLSLERPGPAYLGRWRWNIGDIRHQRQYSKDEDDLLLGELLSRLSGGKPNDIKHGKEGLPVTNMRLLFMIHKRTVMAFSCLAFVLLGIPLGVKAQRRESSAGAAMSLVLIFVFYVMTALAESLVSRPALHPDLIVWLPNLLFISAGLVLMRRST
jgi:lipopolysaccharide export system permease protein